MGGKSPEELIIMFILNTFLTFGFVCYISAANSHPEVSGGCWLLAFGAAGGRFPTGVQDMDRFSCYCTSERVITCGKKPMNLSVRADTLRTGQVRSYDPKRVAK